MSTETHSEPTTTLQTPAKVEAKRADTKLEVIILPVSDVDRAKRFYGSLGWRLDADFSNATGWHVVQMTPPGSECSVHFGTGLTTATPGSLQGTFLVVSDIEAARAELIGYGAEVSEIVHVTAVGGPHLPGPHPGHQPYSSFASFSDPDGNSWLLQEVRSRLPGRGLALNVATLTDLLREAEEHHGQYEAAAPKHHWSGWYAAYVKAREQGRTPEDAAGDAALHLEGAGR